MCFKHMFKEQEQHIVEEEKHSNTAQHATLFNNMPAQPETGYYTNKNMDNNLDAMIRMTLYK